MPRGRRALSALSTSREQGLRLWENGRAEREMLFRNGEGILRDCLWKVCDIFLRCFFTMGLISDNHSN